MTAPAKRAAALIAAVWLWAGCAAQEPAGTETGPSAAQETISGETAGAQEEETKTMLLQKGAHTFSATLSDNAATEELTRMLEEGPLTVELHDFAGFEKVGALGATLPTDDRPITAQPGDIMLYLGDQIVLFYGRNAWDYTPLGRVTDLTGWEEALGAGDVRVTLSLEA